MQSFELAVLDWIQFHCRSDFLDAVLPWVSWICNHGEVWIVLAVGLIIPQKTRRAGLVLSLALILNYLCANVILKPLVARIRPCDVNTAVALLLPRPTDYAFPSGHTAASFAAVAALLASKSRWWKPAFLLAVLIAFSRLYLYVHWPSDVLGGAVVGILVGFLAQALFALMERRLPDGVAWWERERT